MPAPEIHPNAQEAASSASSRSAAATPRCSRRVDRLAARRHLHVDYMRIRAFPFGEAVREFLEAHDTIFVVEQNRDAQLRSLLAIETGVARDRHDRSVLDYGGLPPSTSSPTLS